MNKCVVNKNYASRLRNFIVEFFSVFSIVALNGTFLVLILVNVIDKGFGKSKIALVGALFLLFGCTISTALIYFVKGRVYYNKIKVFCDAADAVANGDFSVRVPTYFVKPKSAMDYLAVNFNKMLTEISSLDSMKDGFIADVSHEIKTPLSVIQGYTELLQKKNVTEEEKTDCINNISVAVNNLKNLTSNILKLNKLENQAIIQKDKYALDEQLRCCVLSLEDVIEVKSIVLEIDLDEINIYADEGLLEIVWNNLLQNAVKFNNDGGLLKIELVSKNNDAVVTVTDNGCGMEPFVVEHIFEKFYQGDTSHSGNGNGLGMALVKKVVDLHNGVIKVESSTSVGTRIQVILPNAVL